MTRWTIGIIGGSGLYAIEALADAEWRTVATPWGEPSDAILHGRIGTVDVRFLPRHGRGHRIPPGEVNARANIDALKRSGCTDILAISSIGSLREELEPGRFVVVEQFIDRTVARPASFVERYGNRGAFIGDPNLRPESAVTVDAGASGAERLGPVRVRTEVAGFASWADDLITYVYAGAQNRAKATNIGSAHLYGVEASATASAYGGEARLSYTGLATENTAQCQRGTCPPLPGRPAHDLVGDLSWALPFAPLVLRYGVDVVAGTRADQEGNIPVPARVLQSVGAKLAVPHVRGLTITLDVRNLLDVRVAEYAGALGPVRSPIGDLYSYPLPGRRALVSVDFAR